MIEDITDYNGSNGMYKQQAPLRPPPLNPPTSIRGSIISPRFDNIATRSSTIPWSPAPFTGAPYEKPSVDPFLTSQQFVRPSEIWTNNNVHPKSTDSWLNNNVHTKSSDPWLNNNAHIKSPDQLVNNNVHPKSSDAWLHNNTQSKTSELWSPSNGFRRAQESIVTSNNSSNAPMIKSSDKTFGFITDRCSPRCKLGILGFVIGFLLVGIALAVVLVLWLRN